MNSLGHDLLMIVWLIAALSAADRAGLVNVLKVCITSFSDLSVMLAFDFHLGCF